MLVKVKVKFYGPFKVLTHGISETYVALDEGATVRDLIEKLALTISRKLAEVIYKGWGEDEELQTILLVNGSATTLDHKLKDGDEILLLPPASGG